MSSVVEKAAGAATTTAHQCHRPARPLWETRQNHLCPQCGKGFVIKRHENMTYGDERPFQVPALT